MADFVARKMVGMIEELPSDRPLRVLDPAVGDGELLICLLQQLAHYQDLEIKVHGFETDQNALNIAAHRLKTCFPGVDVDFKSENFLEFALEYFTMDGNLSLFGPPVPDAYDLIIANPPYVRTQIMGANKAKVLAKQFGLAGRIDLYYAFILAMSQVLKPGGIAGIIVSNRFMTTKSGASVRKALFRHFNVRRAWDLGDTKLFNAAVLPAVMIVEGKNGSAIKTPDFTSIYQTFEPAGNMAANPIYSA